MKCIEVERCKIPYKIAKKRNKNTYFYFKKEGYVQINLSKYQSEKDAVDFIKKHPSKFVKKFQSIANKHQKDEKTFLLLGKEYFVHISDDHKIKFDISRNYVYLPTNDIKHPIIKSFYKHQMITILLELHQKHLSNPYVDIHGVTYKTRYTTSRHGSCNTSKRNINISLYLIQYDKKYIEYVFLHEIAHLIHPNHGPHFYDLLQKLCPNHKQLKQELREIYR